MLDELAARGFKDGSSLEVEDRNANGSAPTQQQIMKRFAGEGLDAIVAITTPTAQSAASATADAILDLGLERRLDDKVGLLSGGQRQAVSLLMATLGPTRVLLLDEHTAALDPKTADVVLGLTARVVADLGLTALMVTHSMAQALHYGDRTVMLHGGRVVHDVSGDERRRTSVADLLTLFRRGQGQDLTDDALLLG